MTILGQIHPVGFVQFRTDQVPKIPDLVVLSYQCGFRQSAHCTMKEFAL